MWWIVTLSLPPFFLVEREREREREERVEGRSELIFIMYAWNLGCKCRYTVFCLVNSIMLKFCDNILLCTGEEQHYQWKGEFRVIFLLSQISCYGMSKFAVVIWEWIYFAPFRCSQINNSVERTCISSNDTESKELHKKRKHVDGEDRSPYGKPDAKFLRSSNHSARGAIPRRSMRLISKVIFFLYFPL